MCFCRFVITNYFLVMVVFATDCAGWLLSVGLFLALLLACFGLMLLNWFVLVVLVTGDCVVWMFGGLY